jgi:hypothetical protein
MMADPISSSILLGAGMGLKGLNTVFQYNAIQEQKANVDRQTQMQLLQNQAGADVNSINSLKQANELYDKQLVASASSGASLSSGSFANIGTSTFNNEQNKEFINQANLNVANLGTLFGAQQQQQQLQSMQTGLVLGTVADTLMTAGKVAGSSFTGSTKDPVSTAPNQFGGGINNPFGSNLSSKTGSALSLFNLGG